MTDHETNDEREANEEPGPGFDRRTVLKMTGSAAVAGTALSGVASAHEINEAVFCGCSQVCACGDGKVRVWIAYETDGGFTCDYVVVDDDPNTDFLFCYEVREGKVVAIEDGDGTVVCNPNNCAEKALADCRIACDRYGRSGGPCGDAFLRTCGQ